MAESAPTDARWTALGRLDAIEVGKGRYVESQGKALCVLRLSETDAAVFDDACPHAGAPLSNGTIEGDCLVCSLHQWPFRISDGVCPDAPEARVAKYATRVVDGVVEAVLE